MLCVQSRVCPIRFIASTSLLHLKGQPQDAASQRDRSTNPESLRNKHHQAPLKELQAREKKILDLLGSFCAESISNCSRCSSFTAATMLAGGLKCIAFFRKKNQPFSHDVQVKALRCCRITCITCLDAHGR